MGSKFHLGDLVYLKNVGIVGVVKEVFMVCVCTANLGPSRDSSVMVYETRYDYDVNWEKFPNGKMHYREESLIGLFSNSNIVESTSFKRKQ